MMKRLVAGLFIISIGALGLVDPVLGAEGERTAETLKQLEHDWADAEKAGDSDKLSRIVADDWIGVESDGRKFTKAQLIARVKSGTVKAMSVELGPMDVKVLGEAAIVQGSDIEKGTKDGRPTSVEINWMDVFAHRDGKWVCVRSQSGSAPSDPATVSGSRWPI